MKRFIKFFACMTAVMLLCVSAGLCSGCSASFYSEKQHIQRVRERAEERYLGEGSEYTGLEVYPLYNEYDELKYMLIELEPQGYIYVYISDWETPWSSMYSTSSNDPSKLWRPYHFEEGVTTTIINDQTGESEIWEDMRVLQDSSGKYYGFQVSHFKAVGIESERRYLIRLCEDERSTLGYVPAVKRNDNYWNLVSWQEVSSSTNFDNISSYEIEVADIYFINNSGFDL